MKAQGRKRPVARVKRPAGRGPLTRLRRTQRQLHKAWDRPLTAYYLIFGSSLLITVLGLVMVYSASMIKALQLGLGDAYFFKKQFLAALIGTGLLLLASRMPVKLHRALSYPVLMRHAVPDGPGPGPRDRGLDQRQPELDLPWRSVHVAAQ